MSQTDISTKEKYYNYVNYTVDVMEEEYDLENENIPDLVFHEANNADIIIYSNYRMDILQNSNKEPERWDRTDGAEWWEVIGSMAFDVFRRDIQHEIVDRGY